jgi:bifunctional DNase/RNase
MIANSRGKFPLNVRQVTLERELIKHCPESVYYARIFCCPKHDRRQTDADMRSLLASK